MSTATSTAATSKKTGNTQLQQAWSTGYREENDTFADFNSFEAAHRKNDGSGTPTRTLSSRQLTGQFEEEVSKVWEEDWDDEDVDDTFDKTMQRIASHK